MEGLVETTEVILSSPPNTGEGEEELPPPQVSYEHRLRPIPASQFHGHSSVFVGNMHLKNLKDVAEEMGYPSLQLLIMDWI